MAEPVLYFGKYRGIVENDVDPMGLGRVRITVPDLGDRVSVAWAMPCMTAAELRAGIVAVPPAGASIWVEFERGDPEFPIWVGGYWTAPPAAPQP